MRKVAIVSTVMVLGFAALVAAQVQQSQSQSTQQSGTGRATASSSSSASARSGQGASANGGQSGTQAASGHGSGASSGAMMIPTHALIYAPGPNNQPTRNRQDILKAQGDYFAGLKNEGKLVMAGPWKDGSGGMLLIRAKDDVEAEWIASNDPTVVEGLMSVTVKGWVVTIVGGPAIARGTLNGSGRTASGGG